MDLENIIEKIKENFSEGELTSRLDNEIFNWVDSDWQEDGEYESEYDWYFDYGGGEAENEIVKEMIRWWQDKYNNGKELNTEEYCKIYNKIIEEYDFLDRF
ncbi:MAG TPA: hypothetical protein VJ912_03860 [Candidatus Nanoarchaeia archaeon]|nr:hypothetical protein [Candidatus Nanoarchaeia archaeon]